MHYYLYAHMPGFFIRAWTARDPDRAQEPLAVHYDKRVLDASACAIALGIRPGMGLDEAKVLLQGSGLIAWEEEPYREAQVQWLDQLAEFSSVIEPDGQDSAWADLAGHPDPYAIARDFARSISRDAGLRPHLGMGSSKWVAKLTADRLGSLLSSAWEIEVREAVERPGEYLESLSITHLAPVEPAHRERLKFLGYRTIGGVAGIPLRTLRGQFGDAALLIRSASKGGPSEPVRALYPPDAIAASIRFDGGTNDAETLALAVGALAKRLSRALLSRDVQAAAVEMDIELEETKQTRRRTFSRPIRTVREAAAAIRLALGEVNLPVLALSVRLPELQKAQERQANLYTARATEDDTAASRAIDSLRKTFGDKSVVRASEKIVPRRVRVLRAWSHATGWQ